MREMVFLFMQQHPLGRYFELEEENKILSTTEKGYGLQFNRICDNGVKQKFRVGLIYSKKWKQFELSASPLAFRYDFFSLYSHGSQELHIDSENININSMEINLNLGFIKFVQEFESKYGTGYDIRYFRFNEKDTKYFNVFLEQLDTCLSLFASIDSLEKFINLFLNSDQTVFSVDDYFIFPDYKNREISPYGEEQLDLAYKIFTYANIYPEKRKRMTEYALNYKYADGDFNEIDERKKERKKLFFRNINLLNDYLVNPMKD